MEGINVMLVKKGGTRRESNCCPEKEDGGRPKLMPEPRMQHVLSLPRSAHESLAVRSVHPHFEFLPVYLCQEVWTVCGKLRAVVMLADLCRRTLARVSGAGG